MSADKLETPVGRSSILTNLGQGFTYRSEADMRDALAAMGWLNGWDVRTEVPTTTGGRADLVLRAPQGYLVAVELKLEIGTQRAARLAFQQADGYDRHFTTHETTAVSTFVCALKVDRDAARPVTALYPHILLMEWWELRNAIAGRWMYDVTRPGRRLTVAARRMRQARQLTATAEAQVAAAARGVRELHLRQLHTNYPAMANQLCDALGVSYSWQRTAA